MSSRVDTDGASLVPRLLIASSDLKFAIKSLGRPGNEAKTDQLAALRAPG